MARAQGSPRKPISFVVGVIVLVLGLIPLLSNFGFIGFNLPAFPAIVASIVALVGGLILLWDAFSETGGFGLGGILMIPSFILAIISLAVGLIPLLASFGVIGFMLPDFVFSVINYLLVITGVLIILGGLQGF